MAYGDPVKCNQCDVMITFRETGEKRPDGKAIYERLDPEGNVHTHPKGGGGYRGKSEEERRDIRRMNAITSAIAWTHAKMEIEGEKVTTDGLLKIAATFETWIVRP